MTQRNNYVRLLCGDNPRERRLRAVYRRWPSTVVWATVVLFVVVVTVLSELWRPSIYIVIGLLFVGMFRVSVRQDRRHQ